MILGVDFDNTIVCYDHVFHAAALERELIPADLSVSKDSVRDYLRAQGQEEAWTELQGYVYGPRMRDALPFPGALEFLARCARAGVPLWIISHKTRHPYRGPQYDLHASARQWLADHSLHEAGLPRDHVIFELTKLEKLQRIGQVGCTHFIDDLPEFLAEPGFPEGIERILFDPNCHHRNETRFARLCAWSEAWDRLFP
jgi:hypothetical protein